MHCELDFKVVQEVEHVVVARSQWVGLYGKDHPEKYSVVSALVEDFWSVLCG